MKDVMMLVAVLALARAAAGQTADDGVPGFSLAGPIPVEVRTGNVWSVWPPKDTSSPH